MGHIADTMHRILATIHAQGLATYPTADGHHVNAVRPGGNVFVSPTAERYELHVVDGLAPALEGITAAIAQAVGASTITIDDEGSGVVYVVVSHHGGRNDVRSTWNHPSAIRR